VQRLQFALFQMDEAKRHLVHGSVPALRVALLLLDNAAEILLDRWIAEELAPDSPIERLRERTHGAGVTEDHPDSSHVLQRHLLSSDQKWRVAHYFDKKIDYVTRTRGMMSPSVGAVLSHVHRYRNAAYHSGRVKTETLRTFVAIELELCCQLVTSLKPSAGYISSEDFSWLEERFGLQPAHLWDDERLASLVSAFRDDPPINASSICETLADNLESRIVEVNEGLDLICGQSRMDRGKALCCAQEFALEEIKDEPPYRSVPRDLKQLLSLEQLSELASFPNRIRAATNPVQGFEVYAKADTLLERIEFAVSPLAGAIDMAIYLQIDIARGK
jgi:hypothetical protein